MGGSLGVLNFTRDKVPYSELQCLNFCQIFKIYQKRGRCFSSWYDSLQFKAVFEKAVGWRIGKIPVKRLHFNPTMWLWTHFLNVFRFTVLLSDKLHCYQMHGRIV